MKTKKKNNNKVPLNKAKHVEGAKKLNELSKKRN